MLVSCERISAERLSRGLTTLATGTSSSRDSSAS
jgi:hypothetical protein